MIRYGDGKAGQWAKSQSYSQLARHLSLLLSASLAGGVALGTALGAVGFATLARAYPQIVYARFGTFWIVIIGVEAVLIALAFIQWRLWKQPLDATARQRIRLLRAGQTEGLVAYALESLDDQWHLFNGIAMKGGGDIDHVLVGPGGLLRISTKSYRGIYTLGENSTVLNNGQRAAEVAESQRLALKFRNWLEVKLDAFPEVKSIPYVQPVLAVPFMYVAFPAKANNVWIVDEDKLRDLAQSAKPALNEAQIRGCVVLLKDLSRSEQCVSVAARERGGIE